MRGPYCGPLDTAGFPKDTYYYFRSIWNQKVWTLHILPHWNWLGEEGTYKQVLIYTNCEQVELYLNNRLIGSKACACPYIGAQKAWYEQPAVQPTTHDLHLTFDVCYEPGELRAVGYQNGTVVMETTICTTGMPVALSAQSDRETIAVDGIAHIEISALDHEGRSVPDTEELIRCEVVKGPAHLIGMDSGNQADLTPYASPERRMLSGRLLAIISADAPGEILVKFSAENMEPTLVSLFAK